MDICRIADIASGEMTRTTFQLPTYCILLNYTKKCSEPKGAVGGDCGAWLSAPEEEG